MQAQDGEPCRANGSSDIGGRRLTQPEWLALLIDREMASRNTRRFQTRMRATRLRQAGAAVEDVDYRTPRKLDKVLFQKPATGRWIAEKRNLLVTGPCGVGKTWHVSALGQKACRDDHTVIYKRLPPALRRARARPMATAASRGCSAAWSGPTC